MVTADRPFVTTSDPRAAVLEHGYVFLPGLLDPERVLATRRALLTAASGAGWLEPGSDPDDALPGDRTHDERDVEDYKTAYVDVQRAQPFHELAHSDALLDVVEQVLGEPSFALPFKIGRFSFPGSDLGPTAPHQDYYYIQGSTDTLTAWVPLGACASGGGRLVALAGSHRLGPLPPIPLEKTPGFRMETSHLGLEWHGGDYQPGDVLLFHSLTVHGAEANTTDHVRVSADYRYQPVADPIADNSLEPHYRVTTWDDVYADWTDDTLQYYWKALPLDVRPVSSSVDGLMTRGVSRLLA